MNESVLPCSSLPQNALSDLLAPYGLEVIWVDNNAALPGSFWGDPEAGLIGNKLFLRPHTPVQSALHETCHYICMDEQRRAQLHTDAGGGYDEENGVCYLQIRLAAHLPGMGQARMMQDMDSWGYSFRLGSTRAWYEQDAEDARQWLLENRLITDDGKPTGVCRLA